VGDGAVADRRVTAILDPLRRIAGVRWSAAVTVSVGAGEAISDSLDADTALPTASIGKLFLLATVLDEIEQGRLDAGELVDTATVERVADSGLLRHLDATRVSVIDLCRFVGAVSDNLATNALIQRVGLARVGAMTQRLGIVRCALNDIVRDVRGLSDPPFLSSGAADELERLMRLLRAGEVVSPAVSAQLIDVLRLNTDLSMVAAAFSLDPLAHVGDDLGIRLFNKTGTQTGTRADVGCVEAGERVATYAVVARFDDSTEARAGVLAAMRDVGAAVGDLIRPPT
jgi:beta-lactamase class A